MRLVELCAFKAAARSIFAISRASLRRPPPQAVWAGEIRGVKCQTAVLSTPSLGYFGFYPRKSQYLPFHLSPGFAQDVSTSSTFFKLFLYSWCSSSAGSETFLERLIHCILIPQEKHQAGDQQLIILGNTFNLNSLSSILKLFHSSAAIHIRDNIEDLFTKLHNASKKQAHRRNQTFGKETRLGQFSLKSTTKKRSPNLMERNENVVT